jgi:5-methylcytosine-specific restriction endonuclease McrA
MKPHIKNYLQYFGYSGQEFVPCEVCGSKAVDIHHIKARGMGGSKHLDGVENCMALCRSCHDEYGDKNQHREFLEFTHRKKLLGSKHDSGELKRYL